MTAILALVTDAFGGRGGIAQYNRDLLAALAASGVASAITVLPRHAPDREAVPSGIMQRAAQPGRLRYALAALRAALRQRYDIVFCGHLYMAPLAWLVARLKRAKLVVQMHGIEAWDRPSRLRLAALDASDLVLCVSRYTRACVSGWATLAPERLLVVPNTVDDKFTPGDTDRLRQELGLVGKKILLTVGRLDSRERYKGHDRIIAVMRELLGAGHDVVYLIVGDGDDRGRLEACARDAGVADRVRFFGTVLPDELPSFYRLADLFVMPSTGEGFGIAFLEAMASGTPALGLAAGGAADALADGELGTASTASDLAVAVAQILSRSKPDPHLVSQKLRARFGRDRFQARIGMAFERLALVPAR